jgi:hypothetical protein
VSEPNAWKMFAFGWPIIWWATQDCYSFNRYETRYTRLLQASVCPVRYSLWPLEIRYLWGPEIRKCYVSSVHLSYCAGDEFTAWQTGDDWMNISHHCSQTIQTALTPTRRAHTHHRSRICRQTPTTRIISTFEPLYVISVKYRLSLPDDGSYVIRNMLE